MLTFAAIVLLVLSAVTLVLVFYQLYDALRLSTQPTKLPPREVSQFEQYLATGEYDHSLARRDLFYARLYGTPEEMQAAREYTWGTGS